MNIYCSGIGGIGLSAYASVQQALGHRVSGSDSGKSDLLDDLRGQGMTITTLQDGSAVPADVDLFVYSEAVPPDHPERGRARELGIPSCSYFQALGDLSRPSFVIAVCGTHGKSSTTAMAARVLLSAGKDPTVIVGTKVPELEGPAQPDGRSPARHGTGGGGRNWRKGGGKIFLLEACEYRKSFHFLSPDLILLTTVDGDHFDYYADVAAYEEAFMEFFRLLPVEGSVVLHGRDPASLRVAAAAGCAVVDADAHSLPALSVPGRHMQENACLVLGMAQVLGISQDSALSSLAGFQGTWRRMEVKGIRPDGVLVVDDYAHHPREILATIAAMKERYPGRRLVCVFQPHTHDRVQKLYDAFTQAFRSADVVVIPNIYAARKESDVGDIDLPMFLRDIRYGSSVTVFGGYTLEEAETFLNEEVLHAGDLLLCMGAGDITGLAERMMTQPPSAAVPTPG
ncbi:hypothetical protein HYS30_03080 [Candidatus Peregrinibacteria bacterium]|nr:hypothetical protein [Candidatus Peregrinibacteria bacterium]